MPFEFDFFKYLQNGSALIFIGILLSVGAVIVLVRTIIGLLEPFWRREQASARRPRLRWGKGLTNLLTALILMFFSLSVLLAGTTLRTYTTFTRQDLVGTIECLEWNPEEKIIIVRFKAISQGRTSAPQTYSLYGDNWEINAHILKWNPKANLMGLHTAYRLNQIKGIYQSAAEESRRPHRAYALTPGKDWIWWFLSRYGESFPLVEAVYGNAVSKPARSGQQFEIFVTTSGLSARRWKK
ncbi:hypothetical protein KAR10_00215 [bacterium]|nr:hypothetical protein [bacterium]